MSLGQDTKALRSEQLNVPHSGPYRRRAPVLFLPLRRFVHWSSPLPGRIREDRRPTHLVC
jgi:hypothetical protein